MTKKLVEEARGRPQKDQTVIDKAKNLFERIEKANKNIAQYEGYIESCRNNVKSYEEELELLRQGKYTLKKPNYTNGFIVVFEKPKGE